MSDDMIRYHLKKGDLEKKGHIRKNWKKRLFVLTSSEISYFEGEKVKGKIPLEQITSLSAIDDDGKSYCIHVKTNPNFNKDFTLSCDSPSIRQEWMDAIQGAKNNQPIPDSVKPVFAVVNTEDALDDPYAYFEGMLTALCEAKNDSHLIDVLLRLCSFFSRVINQGLMPHVEVTNRCEKVVRMSVLIQEDFRKYGQWTQEVELLYEDLTSSINYARSLVASKRFADSRSLSGVVESPSSTDLNGEKPQSNSSITNSPSTLTQSSSASSEVSTDNRGNPRHGFLDHYTMKETLGSGAYSVVYRCEDKATFKNYAVKCIKKHKLQEGDIKSLTTEVSIMGQLDHPNIVRMEAFYDDKEYYFIVSELVDGGELFDKIVEKKYYTENEARTVVRTLVEAIAYCHKLNIAHRDLKPENILIDSSSGNIKIADFGFAKNVGSAELGRLDTDCGSPWYVAPEILRGRMYGTEVDMWSLGVIIYILLCGYPPFHDSNQPKLYSKIRNGKYKFDSPYWDNVSGEAKDLITKLLVVDPTKRFRCTDVLNHSWFKVDNQSVVDKPLMSAIHELRTFNTQRKGIIKQGYLTKQGHIIRNWKRRSFVLTSDKLLYFKSETEKKPRGTIPMVDVTVIVDDPNDDTGFIIKTRNGKDYNIHATSAKEKRDWIVLVNGVKRCFIMKQRATTHLAKRSYREAIEILWEARRDRNMSYDAQLIYLWGCLSHECLRECGAMFMLEAVEEKLKDNVSMLVSFCGDAREKGRMVAGDYQGNVGIFSHDSSSVISMTSPHKCCITAISSSRSPTPPDYVGLGSIDGTLSVMSLNDASVVFTAREHKHSIVCIDLYIPSNVLSHSTMVSVDKSGKIVLWDVGKKKMVESTTIENVSVLEVRFLHAVDRLLAVLSDGRVLTLDGSLHQVDVLEIGTEVVKSQYAADNRLAIAGADGVVRIVDWSQKSQITRIDLGNKCVIKQVDFSRDLDYVLLVSDHIELWRVSPHVRKEGEISLTMPIRALCWSGDFNTFYLSQDSHVEKWVIDWILFLDGKKYSPPLSHFGAPLSSEVSESSVSDSSNSSTPLTTTADKYQTVDQLNSVAEDEETA